MILQFKVWNPTKKYSTSLNIKKLTLISDSCDFNLLLCLICSWIKPTTSNLFLSLAISKGVLPLFEDLDSKLAPTEHKKSTISKWPAPAALCRGVQFQLSFDSMSAPFLMRNFTISLWPCKLAAWSGVTFEKNRNSNQLNSGRSGTRNRPLKMGWI